MAKANLPQFCTIPDCPSKCLARGYCSKHYQLWWSYGDPQHARLTDEQKFWSKVNKNGPVHPILKTACWVWTASTINGYGRIRIGRVTMFAHRYSYFLAHNKWPQPFALHHCDNHGCVRPDHLYAGTLQDNMDDKVARKRQYRKLNIPDINPIRRLIGQKVSYAEIGRRYEVHPQTIRAIHLGRSWRHVEFSDEELPDVKVKVNVEV